MYMSLADLREKFKTDVPFTRQFVKDANEVLGVNNRIHLFKNDDVETGDLDEELLYGNDNLLNTYVNVVSKIIEGGNRTGAYTRLASYIHAPFYREEDFYIDPDTRIITIPGAFNKNGVAVVGDHLAELLFFKMPRFFDVVDLFKCRIYVYWHNTGLKDYSEPHISEPIAIYPDGDDLHFGWYLTEEATGVAGQIEFAVEFVIKDETTGEVTFRLYTQPAKITVKNAIDMDAEGVIPEDRESLIFSRAIYSNVVNLLTAAPAVITRNLPTGDLNLDPETGTITLSVDAVIPAEESATNDLIFGWNWNGVMVEQPSGSTINDKEHLVGVTTYELDSKDPQSGNELKVAIFSDPVGPDGAITYSYEEIADPEVDANPAALGWYVQDNGDYILSDDDEVDNEQTYYERTVTVDPTAKITYKTLTTNVPGNYQVYVGNVVSDSSSPNYGGVRYVYSHTAQIAAASEITIDNKKMPAATYLDNWENRSPIMTAYVEGANGQVVCDWYQQTAAGTTLVASGPATEVLDTENNGTGIYQSTYDPSNGGENTTVSSLRGYYYVEARNIKNNTVERATSNKCFVEVMPLKIPTINLEVIDSGNHIYRVTVNNPQHEAMTYELTGSIRRYVYDGGEERVSETPIYFDNYNTSKFFTSAPVAEGGNNSQTTFALNETTLGRAKLREGDLFSLFVGVLPYTQKNKTGLERYATRVDAATNTEVPARTYDELTSQVF